MPPPLPIRSFLERAPCHPIIDLTDHPTPPSRHKVSINDPKYSCSRSYDLKSSSLGGLAFSDPAHWVVLATRPQAEFGTDYTSRPASYKNYHLHIDKDKGVNSDGIRRRIPVVYSIDEETVKIASENVDPEDSQKFILRVLRNLEDRKQRTGTGGKNGVFPREAESMEVISWALR